MSPELVAIRVILERQVTICTPVPSPATYEKFCGPGSFPSIGFPDCYNPRLRLYCLEYCPVASFCTDASFCPVGLPFDVCGATFTLSLIALPAATHSAPVAESASSVEGTTTANSVSTSPNADIESSSSAPRSSTYLCSRTVLSGSVPVSTPSSSTPSSVSMATQVTNAAGKKGADAAEIACGGFGALYMVFRIG
ncbi:Prp 4 [Diplocarpon rosae]|nr:Prp 4 [Diplocarpon rosae]